MSDPYTGEIGIFGFSFAPRNWASCNGAFLSIQQNNVLFSLIRTNFGGDGVNTFALPNLVGRAAVSHGTGPSLSPYTIGQMAGESTVTLDVSHLPPHSHGLMMGNGTGTRSASPAAGHVISSPGKTRIYSPTAPSLAMSTQSVSIAGQSQPHENRQPYMAMNHCICLSGNYPQFV